MSSKKSAAKKPSPKKPAAKKAAPKKAAPKKAAPKKAAPSKAAPKKAAPKKTAPKKPAAKRAVAKKLGTTRPAATRGPTPVDTIEGVFKETGWTFKKTVRSGSANSGEVIHWDITVPPEEHFDVIAQLFGGGQLALTLAFREHWQAEVRAEVLEALARINLGLLFGSYETDCEHGSVRLKASLDFRGAALDPRLVVNLIVGLMDVSEIYDDALVAVMRGELSAKDAVAEIESEPENAGLDVSVLEGDHP